METLDAVIALLRLHKMTVSQFILELLSNTEYLNLTDLLPQAEKLVSVLVQRSVCVREWVGGWMLQEYNAEMKRLLNIDNGWQFGAAHASAHQLGEFRVKDMAQKMAKKAPQIWGLLGSLMFPLDSNEPDEDQQMRDSADDVWDSNVDDIDLEGIIEAFSAAESASDARESRKKKRRRAVMQIKKVVIMSIMMQSRNKKTNALESVIGIFLHSCKAPEKVVEALARMGISISINSIHQAITSLSAESAADVRDLGQSPILVTTIY